MKKILTTSAMISAMAALSSSADIIKLDGNSAIGETKITASSGTTYTIVDVATVGTNGVLTLTADNEYILDDVTFIDNGVLQIEPGTIIRGEPRSAHTKNDPGALVVTRTARIDAQGTAANPIIFTTAALNNNGIMDGANIQVIDAGTDGAYISKIGTQASVTGGALASGTFLDASPLASPLAPTSSFASDAAGLSPVLIVEVGGEMFSYTETTPEHRSLWGGVIVLGSAPTSIGLIDENGDAVGSIKGDLNNDTLDDIFEGFVEGLNLQEVGDRGVYGGMNPNDGSGVMRYVSIRHGGSSIGAGNEINGLTMGGVGRGTLLEYIEVYCNGDDGYEWFGGTVDSKYLISLWNNDDSFDIDEGFTGRGQFWFSLQGDDTINGDHGGEHDGTDAAHDSINVAAFGSDDSGLGIVPAYVTVYNATYVGGGANGNTQTDSGANRALRIRDSFNGIYRNSVFAEFKDAPVRDDDGDNVGSLTLENNVFYGSAGAYADADALMKSGAVVAGWTIADNTVDENVFSIRKNGFFVAPGFPGNVDAKFDRRGKLNSSVNTVGFDPRPDASAAPSVSSALAGGFPTFYTSTSYKGAFSPTASESNVWTGADGNSTNPAWSVFGKSFLDLQ